jgi:hypothetical protein
MWKKTVEDSATSPQDELDLMNESPCERGSANIAFRLMIRNSLFLLLLLG